MTDDERARRGQAPAAPTDAYLDVLSRQMKEHRKMSERQPSAAFLEYQTVRRYAASLHDFEPAERDRRLAVLEEFSAFVDREPDVMIEEIFNRQTRKYRKRGFYSDNVKAFQAELDGPEHLQLAKGNVIRAFFIACRQRFPAPAGTSQLDHLRQGRIGSTRSRRAGHRPRQDLSR